MREMKYTFVRKSLERGGEFSANLEVTIDENGMTLEEWVGTEGETVSLDKKDMDWLLEKLRGVHG